MNLASGPRHDINAPTYPNKNVHFGGWNLGKISVAVVASTIPQPDAELP